MATLLSSQSPPPDGWVTVGERDCSFVARPGDEYRQYEATGGLEVSLYYYIKSRDAPFFLLAFLSYLQYPDIYVTIDAASQPAAAEEGSAFLPVFEGRWSKARKAWYLHIKRGRVLDSRDLSSSIGRKWAWSEPWRHSLKKGRTKVFFALSFHHSDATGFDKN